MVCAILSVILVGWLNLRIRRNRKVKRILGILLCITMAIGLCACGKENKKETEVEKVDIKKVEWQEMMIEVDGKLIQIGNTFTEVMDNGFETKTEIKEKLGASELTVINFTYEKDNQSETICMGLKNTTDKEINMKDSVLENFSFSNWVYEKFETVLPGGIKLSKDTKIEDIEKEWGKYSEKVDGDPYSAYIWSVDNKNIVFTVKNDTGEIKQISFTGPNTKIGK